MAIFVHTPPTTTVRSIDPYITLARKRQITATRWIANGVFAINGHQFTVEGNPNYRRVHCDNIRIGSQHFQTDQFVSDILDLYQFDIPDCSLWQTRDRRFVALVVKNTKNFWDVLLLPGCHTTFSNNETQVRRLLHGYYQINGILRFYDYAGQTGNYDKLESPTIWQSSEGRYFLLCNNNWWYLMPLQNIEIRDNLISMFRVPVSERTMKEYLQSFKRLKGEFSITI